MAKAKKPNEIREEMRKQMAAKHKQEVEHWKKLAHDRWENYMDATKRLADINDENAKLKEQIEAQKEWIERLMEFVNMPDEQRGAAVKEYVEHRQMSEQLQEGFEGTFGQAIGSLKHGFKVARKGWNGKGMWLWLKQETMVKSEWCHDMALKAIADQNGGEIHALGTICMKTADNKILTGWLASQTDMLSEDWVLVDPNE